MDERRSGHGGGAAWTASRSAWRSRPTAPSPSTTTTTRSAAASAPPTVRVRTPGSSRSTNLGPATYFIDVHPPTRVRATATRTATGTRRRRSTAACSCWPRSRRARRHRCARRAALGAAEQPDGVLVRLRLRAAGVRHPGNRRDHRHGAQLGRVGRRTPSARSTSRWRTRSSRSPTANDRADRLRRPGRRGRQLRHPERPGRHLQPVDLGRAAQLHHALQAGHRRRRRDRQTSTTRVTTAGRGRRRLTLVRLARRHGLQGPERQRAAATTGEPALANTDVDQRWRDGSIKEAHVHRRRTGTTSTRPPRAARSDAGSSTSRASRASRRYPGPSSHDEHTGDVTPSCAVEPIQRFRQIPVFPPTRAAAC